MTKLYEALEVCLNDIEHGVALDIALSRYPEIADEISPIIETSMQAKRMAVSEPSRDVLVRSRARILQRAGELREAASAGWQWSLSLRRAFVSLAVLIVFLFSGTNLVRAASTSLPGEGLYPVKRAWEDVLLFATFDSQEQDVLRLEYENKRLDEIYQLFASGRLAEVDFAGYVTRQNGDEWQVSGITVIVSPRTGLPDQPVMIGMAVHVTGHTQSEPFVIADQIEILPPDSTLPVFEEVDDENAEKAAPAVEGESGSTVENEADSGETLDPLLENEIIEGQVKVIQNNYMVMDGVIVDMKFAEIKGNPRVGVIARAEGYFDGNGIFIALRIEFENGGPANGNNPSNNTSGSNANSNNNENDNDSDDNNNDNDNDNNGNFPDDD